MYVKEAQHIGALMILIASLVIYGGLFIRGLDRIQDTPPFWGNQRPNGTAVEVIGSAESDGIYFLPEMKTIADLLRVIGVDGRIEPPSELISDSAGYTVSVEARLLKITVMPAIKLIAMGLPLDLNQVSVEDLSSVPGVGERLAAQIVELRKKHGKIESMSELMTIRGIKERKLDSLNKYLMVRNAP